MVIALDMVSVSHPAPSNVYFYFILLIAPSRKPLLCLYAWELKLADLQLIVYRDSAVVIYFNL